MLPETNCAAVTSRQMSLTSSTGDFTAREVTVGLYTALCSTFFFVHVWRVQSYSSKHLARSSSWLFFLQMQCTFFIFRAALAHSLVLDTGVLVIQSPQRPENFALHNLMFLLSSILSLASRCSGHFKGNSSTAVWKLTSISLSSHSLSSLLSSSVIF